MDAVSCAVLCYAVQPLYKKLLGFEVFGLGFMTSVVSGSCIGRERIQEL